MSLVLSAAPAAVAAPAAAPAGRSSEGGDFLRCRFVHVDDFAGEVQGFARERMVEVHHDHVFFDLEDRAVHAVAVGVHHRDGVALLYHFGVELAIDFEDMLRQVEDVLFVVLAVSVGRRDAEVELLSRLKTHQFLFEGGNHHPGAVDELQGDFARSLFHQFAFFAFTHVEVVDNRNVFVV